MNCKSKSKRRFSLVVAFVVAVCMSFCGIGLNGEVYADSSAKTDSVYRQVKEMPNSGENQYRIQPGTYLIVNTTEKVALTNTKTAGTSSTKPGCGTLDVKNYLNGTYIKFSESDAAKFKDAEWDTEYAGASIGDLVAFTNGGTYLTNVKSVISTNSVTNIANNGFSYEMSSGNAKIYYGTSIKSGSIIGRSSASVPFAGVSGATAVYLFKKVDNYDKEIKDLKSEVADIQKDIKEITEVTIPELKEKLAEETALRKAADESLEKAIKAGDDELAKKLEAELAKRDEEINKLQADLKVATIKLDDHTKRLDEINKELEKLAEADAKNAKALQETKDDLQKQIDDLKKKIDTITDKTIPTLQKELADEKAARETKEGELADAIKAGDKELSEKIDEEIAKIDIDIEDLQDQIDDAEARLDRHRTELNKINAKLKDLENADKETAKEIAAVKSSIVSGYAAISAALKELKDESDKKVAELEAKIKELNEKMNSTDKEIAALKDEIATMKFESKKVSLSSVKAGKNSIKVRYKAVDGAEEHTVYYKDKSAKKAKAKYLVTENTVCSIKDLKSKHKYTVKVKAKTTIGEKAVYTQWSKAKTVTVK